MKLRQQPQMEYHFRLSFVLLQHFIVFLFFSFFVIGEKCPKQDFCSVKTKRIVVIKTYMYIKCVKNAFNSCEVLCFSLVFLYFFIKLGVFPESLVSQSF